MTDVIIIGAGGHGKVVADIVRARGDKILGFLDDSAQGALGKISDYGKFYCVEFVVAIGDNRARKQIAGMLENVKWYTPIHPTAIISPSAVIGEGTVVMPGAVINADAKVGRHCIINTTAVVEHDCKIGDFCHISVGAKLGGTVRTGEGTMIGIGAAVRNNTEICKWCTVGAGAVVVKPINAAGVYVGVPAGKSN